MSSAYLRLLIFLLAILIPDCASSSLAFCMMLNKLNMLDDDIQPSCTLLPIWNHSVVPCLVLEATGPLCFLWKLLEDVCFWHMREENEKLKHWAFRSQEPRKERGEGTAKMTVKGSQEEQLCPAPQSSGHKWREECGARQGTHLHFRYFHSNNKKSNV